MTEVVLLGASVRAMAQSAAHAGFQVRAIDLFADRDLQAIARTSRLAADEYPHGFARCKAELAGAEWCYAGGLENYPDLLDLLATDSKLLGNDGNVVRIARDPRFLSEVVNDIQQAGDGLRAPGVAMDPTELPTDGSWLRKPRRGGGGRGIERWFGQQVNNLHEWQWQKFQAGVSWSAVYAVGRHGSTMLGCSRQLIGEPLANGKAFQYCGNVAGEVDAQLSERLSLLGNALAKRATLRGVVGVDFIVDERQTVWPIELNPRCPASAELFEIRDNLSVFSWHRNCCLDLPMQVASRTNSAVGKVVYFANQRCRLARDLLEFDGGTLDFEFADVPDVGARFESGEPVATILAVGDDEAEAIAKLQAGCRHLAHWLQPSDVAIR